MSWHESRMLLGDAETTGVDPHRDRIVTFCLIEGGRGQKPLAHNWLIAPDKGVVISDGAAKVHGIDLSEQDAHGAEADALAAGRVAWAIAAKHPGATGPAMDIHRLCVEQKRVQADSFGAYLVKQGKPDDVSREWPVASPPTGWTPQQLPEPREADAA